MEDLALMLVFERLVDAGRVELADNPTMRTEILLMAPLRGLPMGLLVFLLESRGTKNMFYP